MSTSLPVKCHLPLITTRIEFEFNVLPSPPQITPRRDLGAVIRRRARRNMPYIRPDREVTPIATNTKHFESPLTEIDSEADTSDVESTTSYKISKPKGEAGKTNSGGYNLQCAMGWENTEFSNFTKYINEEAAKKLDVKICYSKQRREDLDNLIQSTAKRFEIQGRYYDDWPIRDALKMRLKYTSDWDKKKSNRNIEARLKEALRPQDN